MNSTTGASQEAEITRFPDLSPVVSGARFVSFTLCTFGSLMINMLCFYFVVMYILVFVSCIFDIPGVVW